LSSSVAITPFAVAFRYDQLPPAAGDQDRFDRPGAVALASAAVAWALGVISGK
jgi:hypothetical protein